MTIDDTLLTRRQILSIFGAGTGAAIVAESASALVGGSGDDGKLYGGYSGMAEAYKVGPKLWKGPLAARSDVPKEDGNDFIQTDAGSGNDLYKLYHYNNGWSSQGFELPSLTTDVLNNVRYPDPADNVPGIQTAIDNLPSEGGIIHLRPGQYDIEDGSYNTPAIQVADQQFSKGFAIVGAGPRSVIYLPDNITETDKGKQIINIGDNDPADARPQDNVLLQNFKIDGNQQNQGSISGSSDGHNVMVEGSNFVMRNVRSVNATGDGIEPERHTADDTEDILIEGCLFEKNYEHDIHIHSVKRLIVRGNIMLDTVNNYSITFFGHDQPSEDVTIANNIIGRATSDGILLDSQKDNQPAKNVQVVNNDIFGCGAAGILVVEGGGVDHSKQVFIHNNRIIGNSGHGINVRNAKQTSITNNFIYKNDKTGIALDKNPIKSVFVDSNFILNNNQGGGSADGLALHERGGEIKDVKISNNYVVSDEFVTNKHEDGITFGSFTSATKEDIILKDNYVTGASDKDYYLAFQPTRKIGNYPKIWDLNERLLNISGGGTALSSAISNASVGDDIEVHVVPDADPDNDVAFEGRVIWDDSVGSLKVRVEEKENSGGGDARVLAKVA